MAQPIQDPIVDIPVHVCVAEHAPDVWMTDDPDPLVGTKVDAKVSRAKFSKVLDEPVNFKHRGQRGGPVLKSVQCDICGDTEFSRRCRQCGFLQKAIVSPCLNCDSMAKDAGSWGIYNDDWEEVSP